MEIIKKRIIRNLKKWGIDFYKIPKEIREKYEKQLSDIIEENLEELLDWQDVIDTIKCIYIWKGELKIELWEE